MKYEKTEDQVILDINEDLVKNLSKEQISFWDNQLPNHKNYFVHMSEVDKAKLMSGTLTKEETDLYWKNCSKLVLHYANEGHGLLARAKDLYRWGSFLTVLALVSICSDIGINTYYKNKKLENVAGSSQSVEEILKPLAINSNQKELIKPDHLMLATDFVQHIQTPGSKCSPLVSIQDSFYQADGTPYCFKDAVGIEWVAGYVKYPTTQGLHAEPVLVQKIGGEWRSVEITDLPSPALPDLKLVPYKEIEGDLHKAFNNNKKGE